MIISASCVLTGPIFGFIFLTQSNGVTEITGKVNNLTVGLHGFHIHAVGELGDGCRAAGAHYNPGSKTHSAPQALDRHDGDLGNILAGDDGVAVVDMVDTKVQLSGERSVIGRSIVVHAKEDDLGLGGDQESLLTGNAGGRIACCVIYETADPASSIFELPLKFFQSMMYMFF